jgi:NhaP-type Na+/H+ or K+/H+ antiporter
MQPYPFLLSSNSFLTEWVLSVPSLFGISGQGTTSSLDLEHALIMVLLLMGLLSIRAEQRRYVPWVVLAGIALSLITPFHSLEPAWPFISAVALPPLLWQLGMRLAMVRPAFPWRGWVVGLATALLIGLTLNVGGGITIARALLLGILAASLIWQVRERATGSTDLGAFGQLTLALLLVEVDLVEQPLEPLLGRLFSGAGIGLVIGVLGVHAAFRLKSGDPRNLFCLGLAYLAYVASALLGSSGVVSAAMTGLTVAVYGYNGGLWPTMAALPNPLNRRGVFLLLAAVWLVLGWQAHVPVKTSHVLGIGMALVAAGIGFFLGRRIAPLQVKTAQSWFDALWRKERKVFLLLSGTLLLWPKGTDLGLEHLVVALLAALLTVLILRTAFYPIFDLFGVELRLPEEISAGEKRTD